MPDSRLPRRDPVFAIQRRYAITGQLDQLPVVLQELRIGIHEVREQGIVQVMIFVGEIADLEPFQQFQDIGLVG